jgi:hypothetical protein
MERDVEVRLRVLSPRLTEDESRRAALLVQMRLASAVRHPAFIAIHDVGEINGRVYVCQEAVSQVSLDEQVEANGPLAPSAACKLIQQLAAALQDVSASGIVTADICPGNLYLLPDGQIKVDGLGCSFKEGLPEYSSPEELDGAVPDARSHVYSLGACLFYLLTGTPPFGGTDQESLRRMLRQGRRPLASEVSLAISHELALYAQKMMSPSPAERPESLAEVVQKLDEMLSALLKAELEAAPASVTVAARRRTGPGVGEACVRIPGPEVKAGEQEAGAPSPAQPASQDKVGTAPSAAGVSAPPDSAEKICPSTAPTPRGGTPVGPDAEDLREEAETVIVGADTRYDLERIVHERREREQAKTVMLSETMLDGDAVLPQDGVSTDVPEKRRKRANLGEVGGSPFDSTRLKPAGAGLGGPKPGWRTGKRLLLALVALLLTLFLVAAAIVRYLLIRGN